MTVSTITEIQPTATATAPRAKRFLIDLLTPLNCLTQSSASLIAKPAGQFDR